MLNRQNVRHKFQQFRRDIVCVNCTKSQIKCSINIHWNNVILVKFTIVKFFISYFVRRSGQNEHWMLKLWTITFGLDETKMPQPTPDFPSGLKATEDWQVIVIFGLSYRDLHSISEQLKVRLFLLDVQFCFRRFPIDGFSGKWWSK